MKLRCFLLSVAGIALLSSPVQAARLESWYFDQAQNQLNITTETGVQPRAFLIKNPTRLVIDLPNTDIDGNTMREAFGQRVREVRIGKVDDKTARVVVELAPGYTVAPEKVLIRGDSASHWIINLASIERDNSGSSESSDIKFPVQIGSVSPFAGVVPLNSEISQLSSQLKSLMARYKSIEPGMFFLDLDTGNYVDYNGEKIFSAASTIKYPILIALFQEIDAGRVKLNESLVMRGNLMTGGSGTMQYKRPGTRFSLLETATKMITISDNTATNMIIDRLGGRSKLNSRFRSWGLQNTVIRNLLGDFKGTNTTSPKDLVRLSALIANKQLLSNSSHDRVINIMRRVENRSLLASGLGKGATIAHKTGTLGVILGDAGIIEMPSGKRYLAGIMVRRPFGDSRGREFISQASRIVYGYLSQSRIAGLER